MTKASRTTLIIFASIFVLLFLASLIVPIFLEDHYEDKLIEEFRNQTKDTYQLKLKEIDIGIWSRSVSADSVSIERDSGNNHPLIKSIDIQSIKIDGISWFSLMNNSIPDFHSLTINRPKINLYSRDFSSSALSEFTTSSSSSKDSGNTKIPLFNVHIVDGAFEIEYPKGGEESSLEAFNLDAQQVNIQAIMQDTVGSFMENLAISAENFTYMMEDKLYRFSFDEFNIHKKDQIAKITSFAFSPILPKYEFSEIRGHQLDRIDLNIDEIELRGFELDSLPYSILNLDTLIVKNGWLEVFRDKNKPKAPGFSAKPLVNDMANSLNFPFSLDAALIANSTIIYEEHNPPSDDAGHISFNDLDAVLRNFTTASHPDFVKDTLTLYVETEFMDAAQLTVDIQYPVFREDDKHTVKTHLNPFDPEEVSEMLEKVGFIRVESGMVEELSAEMVLDDTSSTGQVKLIYNDLEVSMLNKDDPNRDGIKEQVADFITNKFAIKSNNSPEDPRIGEVNYEKEAGKSIFAYWWRSLLSGIQDSIK